jgi:hypothetical protein
MDKGNYPVEYIIGLILCILVLVVAYLVLTGAIKNPVAATKDTGSTYSECMSWQRQGYSKDSFIGGMKGYPTLWQNYGSSCMKEDDKTKAKILEFDDSKCKKDSTDPSKPSELDTIVNSAKSACTWESKAS